VQKRRKDGYKSQYPVLTGKQLGLVNQMSDDFNKDARVGDMIDIDGGMKNVSALYGTDTKIALATGFDDITAINAFQRMIDPGAVVKEGDVTLLQSSIPWLELADPSFKWKEFTKGDKLPSSTRKSLLRVAAEIYNTKAADFNETTGARYQRRADAAGINFNLIGDEYAVFNTPVEPTIQEQTNMAFDDELAALEAELASIESELQSQE